MPDIFEMRSTTTNEHDCTYDLKDRVQRQLESSQLFTSFQKAQDAATSHLRDFHDDADPDFVTKDLKWTEIYSGKWTAVDEYTEVHFRIVRHQFD